jgi:histidinol-phosphate/aromatic aminotransferase/cobyric acid decarboxylase-like protein
MEPTYYRLDGDAKLEARPRLEPNNVRSPIEAPRSPGGPTGTSYHGGSDVHRTPNLRLDMSVTCNKVVGAADDFISGLEPDRFRHLIGHYPPNQDDPELSGEYFRFLNGGSVPPEDCCDADPGARLPNVLFGNGATELIDLVVRLIPPGDWKTNFVRNQYREYHNSCARTGRTQRSPTDKDVRITVVINPNNPTGDFLQWSELINYVDNYVPDDSYLIVDESMLFWHGPDWTAHSFTSHPEVIESLRRRQVRVVVIQSWTKIFNCCGLRVGSAMIHDSDLYQQVRLHQPPWSLNAIAREYLLHCFRSPKYLEATWSSVPRWRAQMVERLSAIAPDWTFHGAEFVSWIWIDTHDESLARWLTKGSQASGYPIRHGVHGYGMPTFVRLAVADPAELEDWFETVRCCVESAPRSAAAPEISVDKCLQVNFVDISVQDAIVIDHMFVDVNRLRIHELCVPELAESLYNYIKATDFGIALPSIIVGIIPRVAPTDSVADTADTAADTADPSNERASDPDRDRDRDSDQKVLPADAVEYFVIDGHHRLEVLQRIGFVSIPVTVVKYNHPLIFIVPPKRLSENAEECDAMNASRKRELVETIIRGEIMPPKSTQHVVQIPTGLIPIVNIGRYMIGQTS